MKKTIACIIALFLVFSSLSSWAIDSDEVQPVLEATLNTSDNFASINLTVGENYTNRKALLRVYKEGQDVSSVLVWADEGRIDVNGTETFVVDMHNYEAATYRFICTIENTEIVCEDTIIFEPGTDGPGTDGPGTDGPGTDGPGTDGPGTDGPGTDGPGTDGPGTDGPGADGPGTDGSSQPVLEAKLNLSNNSVDLTVSVDKENSKRSFLIRVFKENSGEGTQSNLLMPLWADEGRINKEGLGYVSIDMNNYDTSEYRFVCTVEKTNIKCEDSLMFYGLGEKELLWEQIKTAIANKDKNVIEWVIANRGEYLALNISEFDSLKSKSFDDEFLASILSNNYVSLEDFVKKFNQTIILSKLYDCEKNNVGSIISSIVSSLTLEETKTYKKYAKRENAETITTVVNEKLFNVGKTLSVDSFAEHFNSAVVLELLGEEKQLWTGYENVLKSYSSEAKLNLEDYANVHDKQSVIEDLIDLHETFDLLSSLKTEFDKLVKSQLEKEGYGSGGSDGGNSSTGSSSSGETSGGKPSSVIIPNGGESSQTGSSDKQEGQTVIPSKTRFTDTGVSAWAEEAIEYLAERGIISGNGNGEFEPERPITRAEIVKLLVVAFGIETNSTETVFEDVSSKEWYAPYISAASKAGLINGISENIFAPNAYVSRQDIAVMVNRLNKGNVSDYELTFSDNNEISDYAEEAVKSLVATGILNGMGDNKFAPKENCTRAQAAKILFEMIKPGV